MNDKSIDKNFVTKTTLINKNNIEFNTQSANEYYHTSSSSSDYSNCNTSNTIISSDYNSNSNNNNRDKNRNIETLLSDSPLHRLIPYARMNSKDKKLLIDNNLLVINGKFSKYELEILTKNWQKFCDDYECDEDMKTRLLGFFAFSDRYSKPERKTFRYFMRSSQFLLRLANGLPNRSIHEIYYTARRKFNTLKRISQLSDADKIDVNRLPLVYGRKWAKIAEKYQCNPSSLSTYYITYYDSNGEPYYRGKWTPDEDRRLLAAMRRVLNTDDLRQHIFTKNIPYKQIRDLAEINRSEIIVANRWYTNLRWFIAQWDQLEDQWTHKDSARLVYCLFRYNFTDESDIDWDVIKEKFANISSFNALMRNWRLIKQTVPTFESKSYKQIIDFLYDNLLPQYLNPDDDGLKEFEIFFDN
ncbi:cyclin-D-binding Myb-like transcription factor 1 [Oppia nitens]|uniref:cyclin-D-binding Myb-like transcription factor 1 n=1 Tax=Oppia nitens TaxID=1686743 RepID=UPI0023DB6A0D|nr:cyclin-D-binding Myb-like transcription factor 1 [Oppia nitens]